MTPQDRIESKEQQNQPRGSHQTVPASRFQATGRQPEALLIEQLRTTAESREQAANELAEAEIYRARI